MQIEAKLEAMGLALPALLETPGGLKLPFTSVRVRGNRAYIAGHGPQNPDGTLAMPLGKVGADLTVDQGYEMARLCTLSMLASIKRELGDLDRVAAWLRVFGMVSSAPDFVQQPAVINGCSELLIELFGPECGAHSRSAVGMVSLPFNIPVEIEAEIEIS